MDGPDADSGLHFPDVPKLELDQLIDQLVDRAHGVKRAQGRLRALLRAIEAVTGELSLESVLRNTVEAARELTSARYAAIATVGSDGGIDRFLPTGVDAEIAARIGRLPQGKGLLGVLLTEPQPIRLAHLADDARSVGFPPGHPPIDSFLGVPIHVRGTVFGSLYLGDSEKGAFTVDDEQLLVALASASGTAISNARLFDESHLQQRWLAASVEISAKLLGNQRDDPLQIIARRALELADADAAILSVLTDDQQALTVQVAVGPGADALVGQSFARDQTIGGLAVELDRPLLRSADNAERPSVLEPIVEAGPVMALPLRGAQQIRGVLTVARRTGRRPFTDSDLTMAAGFASQASVALELADSRASGEKVVLLEDRERIARDLHDHVIQELFAIGLSLESVVASLGPDDAAAQRIRERVEDIDRTIRRIRTSIFALRGSLDLVAGGLRQHVLDVAEDLTPALGFSPAVSFSGPVDLATSVELADDVVAAVRETLANVAKHARATSVTVSVEVTSDDVRVTVVDDGIGLRTSSRSSGIANLRARAQSYDGTFTVVANPTGGTIATWTARVS
jgi:signal transduction histidine kinase